MIRMLVLNSFLLGALFVVFGALIIKYPQIISWLVGIFFIIIGLGILLLSLQVNIFRRKFSF